MRAARLILEDGTVFCGWSFGAEQNTVGEVVFNTAMTGYPESLTDPSYAGQILTFTYPLIGNYGVPETSPTPDPGLTPNPSPEREGDFVGEGSNGSAVLPRYMESDQIHPKAVIVADYSEEFSHWNAKESLGDWLKREGIPAITGIDTRRLTKVLREHGVMMGSVVIEGAAMELQQTEQDYGSVNWVEKVSCKEVITYKPDNSKLSTDSQLSTKDNSLS